MDTTLPAAPSSSTPQTARPLTQGRRWWPWLTWLAGWSAMLLLDGRFDLSNEAMLLMLTSVVASLWWPGWASALASTVAVLAFNWSFVPPRHTFSVDLQQHALLLLAMLVVNWIIAGLVVRLRQTAEGARLVAEREARLRAWSDTLRDAPDPAAHASALHTALTEATGADVALAVLQDLNARPEDDTTLHVGQANGEQREGLALCMRDGRPMGEGTARYGDLRDWYLPLRGRGATLGAAVLPAQGQTADALSLRAHLQALCDQMGQALQRSLTERQARASREQAQLQATRNALLAAISHDYRTPLATIMGAASSLHDQADKLDAAQRQRLAAGIVEETTRLSRLTDNTLQLARLDAPGVVLRRDWESAEEIVGAVLGRARRRGHGARLKAWVEPGLPLLWCDTLLVSQLLDNLVDNALKYSPAEAPVEVQARLLEGHVSLSVSDRGPGIALAWRERVFDVFQRGDKAGQAQAGVEAARQGAGVGLAVCRAIARAHGGELRLSARPHGGCRFDFRLPLHEPAPGAETPPPPEATSP
ncbi:sensor histidine kinase [Hydrogenophaga sp. MI9]|uniref:sensor histidine kinase n=1 Tax=Hydrogenophaga sp. MI9 TaxID=3453719 RepID=UPI003EE869E3